MALTLPNGGNVFLPMIPKEMNKETSEYIQKMVTVLEERFRKDFENVNYILSTGTSGSFVDSDGNTVTVQSGIITALA